jgi:DNA-binding FrmR family transcriptional regulator
VGPQPAQVWVEINNLGPAGGPFDAVCGIVVGAFVALVAFVMPGFARRHPAGRTIRLSGQNAGALGQSLHRLSGPQGQDRHQTFPRHHDPKKPAHPLPGETLVAGVFLLLALSPHGGYPVPMSEPHVHASHPAIATRLKRAEGHLRRVIGMIEEGRPCVDLATQLHAVERAVAEAKRALIHDHIDHCVTAGGTHDLAELKSLTKLL